MFGRLRCRRFRFGPELRLPFEEMQFCARVPSPAPRTYLVATCYSACYLLATCLLLATCYSYLLATCLLFACYLLACYLLATC